MSGESGEDGPRRKGKPRWQNQASRTGRRVVCDLRMADMQRRHGCPDARAGAFSGLRGVNAIDYQWLACKERAVAGESHSQREGVAVAARMRVIFGRKPRVCWARKGGGKNRGGASG